MTFTIHKGKHRSFPFIFGLHSKKWMERDVVFDSSAAYELNSEDQNDVNKLFGFGYFNGHHQDSARFGWNYSAVAGRVRLYAYCYVNGERIIKELCEVHIHKKVRCLINIYQYRYAFTVHDGYNNWHQLAHVDVEFDHKRKWKYKLGCFFGGNNPAPHDITIKISKK